MRIEFYFLGTTFLLTIFTLYVLRVMWIGTDTHIEETMAKDKTDRATATVTVRANLILSYIVIFVSGFADIFLLFLLIKKQGL